MNKPYTVPTLINTLVQIEKLLDDYHALDDQLKISTIDEKEYFNLILQLNRVKLSLYGLEDRYKILRETTKD